MKILLSLLTLTVSLTLSAQQYRLLIGSNINNRELKGTAFIDNPSTGLGVVDNFTYKPEMGDPETVARAHLKVLAEKYSPPQGMEQADYVLGASFDPQPFLWDPTPFRFKQSGSGWVVPQEALEAKLGLAYGNLVLYISGITTIELDVEDATGKHHFSTDSFDGYSDAPCYFGVQQSELQRGAAFVDRKYTVPEYQATIGLRSGRLTLKTSDGFVAFDILDGRSVGMSTTVPKSFEQFRVVPQPPRIARVARHGSTTEIVVSGNAGSTVFVEVSQNLHDWQTIPSYPMPLKLQTDGATTFTHETEAPASFYRVRLADTSAQ